MSISSLWCCSYGYGVLKNKWSCQATIREKLNKRPSPPLPPARRLSALGATSRIYGNWDLPQREIKSMKLEHTDQRSVIKSPYRIHDPNFKKCSPDPALKLKADPRPTVFQKSANPVNLSRKSAISALLKAKSSDLQSYLPPSRRLLKI